MRRPKIVNDAVLRSCLVPLFVCIDRLIPGQYGRGVITALIGHILATLPHRPQCHQPARNNQRAGLVQVVGARPLAVAPVCYPGDGQGWIHTSEGVRHGAAFAALGAPAPRWDTYSKRVAVSVMGHPSSGDVLFPVASKKSKVAVASNYPSCAAQ